MLGQTWQTEVKRAPEDAMTEMTEEIVVPDSPAELTQPKFTRLEGVSALDLCDRHSHVFAVVQIVLPSGGELLMCGHCARKNFGYEHTQHAPADNRQKGSAH